MIGLAIFIVLSVGVLASGFLGGIWLINYVLAQRKNPSSSPVRYDLLVLGVTLVCATLFFVYSFWAGWII